VKVAAIVTARSLLQRRRVPPVAAACPAGGEAILARGMFTGIVSDVGTIARLEDRGDLRARIRCAYAPASIGIGASIACDGVCLTVVDRGPDGDGAWFDVDVSAETVARTNIRRNRGAWAEGRRVNLERALRLGDELGGHIVSGHVDGLAEITGLRPEGESVRFSLRAPDALARFVAPKGSVALNGTSLTVNEVDGASFGVNVIPHTLAVTTWGAAQAGDLVNMEIDTLARYVARLSEYASA
jgi:riboflavin synthase